MCTLGPGNIYWLASYPKSGNTWVRLFLANLLSNANEPIDINAIKLGAIASDRMWVQSAYCFDLDVLTDSEIDRLRPAAYQWLSEQSSRPSFHKIHDAYCFVAEGTPIVPLAATRGVIYLIRNPLDIAVSYASHLNRSIDWTIQAMGNPKLIIGGHGAGQKSQLRQRILNWSGHVQSWIEALLPRLVVRYEDLLGNPMNTFTQIAAFAAPDANEADIQKAIQACDFTKLANKESQTPFCEKPPHTERFFRQGEAGAWQYTLTSAQLNKLINDHQLMMRYCGYLDERDSPNISPWEIAY